MSQHGKDQKRQGYRMCMLHLEKLVPESMTIGDEEHHSEKEKRQEKSFFCYGYYNKLTYIEEKEDDSFTYEHAFLIKYPYTEAEQNIVADQLFTLLEPEEEIQNKQKNPFMEDMEYAPFLGVFLITINFLQKKEPVRQKKYEQVLQEHRMELQEMLRQLAITVVMMVAAVISPKYIIRRIVRIYVLCCVQDVWEKFMG
ncbi:MAG: hypothetical protein NC318_07910 [Blautia sp.]|nr:hypothetical protein [Blautia sp.]